MKVWQLSADVRNYEAIVPVIPFSAEQIQSFDGRSYIDSWEILKMKVVGGEEKNKDSDMLGFILPVFSKKALEILYPLIKDHVEILTLDYDGVEYYAINVVSVIDAIDYAKSKFKTFSNSSRIMLFEKYAFIAEKVVNVGIFKISDEKRRFPFVSDEFKQLVEQNHLKGFKFKLVWDDEM